LREIGFSVRLTEDDARLRYILEHIERSSISSTGQFITPVTILDYVKPDPGAFVAAVSGNSNPYTIRIGMIEVEPGSGTMGENTNRKGTGGLKFVFTQTALSKA
jgi:hypothetical protein